MESSSLQNPFPVGSVICERYEVLELKGKGGMGSVLKVRDISLDGEITALKLLHPHLVGDATNFQRFRNEVIITRRLAHPNIIRLYDLIEASEDHYLISMEYVEGSSLDQRIYEDRENRPDFASSVRILYAISLGLACAHRFGIVHRDLKPDNILLGELGSVKVSDFGLARSLEVEKGLTNTGETVGTPYYMAPEQFSGERPDHLVDIYSLGIIAFELVLGRRPFFDENYLKLAALHSHSPLPAISTAESGIPPWFEEFVETCSAKNRKKRYPNADEAARMLRKHMAETERQRIGSVDSVLTFYTPQKKERTGSSLSKALWGTLAVIFAVGIFLFVLALSPGGQGVLDSKSVLRSLSAPLQRFTDGFQKRPSHHANNMLSMVEAVDISGVKRLLDDGADPNISDDYGKSALIAAIATKNLELVELLLKHGADPNRGDARGESPLIHAVRGKNQPIVGALLIKGAKVKRHWTNPLVEAARADNITAARILLKEGASVDTRDGRGRTALSYAAELENPDLLALFAEANADLNGRDETGSSALIYAARSDNPKTIKFLLEHNADASIVDARGKTAIDYASEKNRRFFIEKSRKDAATGTTSPPISTKPRSTRIRVMEKPKGTFSVNPRNQTTRWDEISVKIKNVGASPAENVSVIIVTPGGQRVSLKGPKKLGPNQSFHYVALRPVTDRTVARKKLQVLVECSNCRN